MNDQTNDEAADPLPTPEDAARAVREIDVRRMQATRAGRRPRWLWICLGLVVGLGLAREELFPASSSWAWWAVALAVVLVAVVLLSRSGMAAFGIRVESARTSASPSRFAISMVGFAIVVVAFTTIGQMDIPYIKTTEGLIVAGLFGCFGPAWESWLLGLRRKA
jgi:predicted lysophospholipase L1 biosynthesis ABC-type transport system permease subunit